jgi:predicted nucleotidyltransferase
MLLVGDNGHFRSIIWFGAGAASDSITGSDIDILVLIEPDRDSWSAKDNIEERRRLEAKIVRRDVPVDLFVRTVDQFEEAKGVVGGIEYAAAFGRSLFSRPQSRPPKIVRSVDEIRQRNVGDWLELARRLLGHSAQLTFHGTERGLSESAKPPQHYALRSIYSSVGAVFVRAGLQPPSKLGSPGDWLAKLEISDGRIANRLRNIIADTEPSAGLAHKVLIAVVTEIAVEEAFRPLVAQLVRYLSVSVDRLAPTQPLKVTGFLR